MSPLHRILDSYAARVAVGVLVCLNHIMLGLLAWRGEAIALVMLVVFSMIWVFFAVSNGIARTKNLRSWAASLEAWDETQKLATNYVDLLMEACDALATWDRERAEEIVSRTRTISALRQANFDERMGND